MANYIYNSEDIFQEIDGTKDDVLMNIPPEIAEKMGWQPGDVLQIKIEESGGISITKVSNG
jgi:hypothetical protein